MNQLFSALNGTNVLNYTNILQLNLDLMKQKKMVTAGDFFRMTCNLWQIAIQCIVRHILNVNHFRLRILARENIKLLPKTYVFSHIQNPIIVFISEKKTIFSYTKKNSIVRRVKIDVSTWFMSHTNTNYSSLCKIPCCVYLFAKIARHHDRKGETEKQKEARMC